MPNKWKIGAKNISETEFFFSAKMMDWQEWDFMQDPWFDSSYFYSGDCENLSR